MPTVDTIPDCPVFPRITICGVEHTITPTGKTLDDFVRPVLQQRGLRNWSDCGFSEAISLAACEWWPEEPVPVQVEHSDDEGNVWPRWSHLTGLYAYDLLHSPDKITAEITAQLEETPEDAEEIRAYVAYLRRRAERGIALADFEQAAQAMGQIRYQQVVDEVVADLDKHLPGFVSRMVAAHCRYPHKCSEAEHLVRSGAWRDEMKTFSLVGGSASGRLVAVYTDPHQGREYIIIDCDRRPAWIDAAAKECADRVLVGEGERTFAEIIERHAQGWDAANS